jgi:hypothetical protein
MTVLTSFIRKLTHSTGIAIGACDDGHLPITKTNCGIPILMHIGGEICEINCEHGVWHIER